MIIKTTTKTDGNVKFIRKVREEKVEAISNHKLFSEKFICDPMKVLSRPIGAVNFIRNVNVIRFQK